jgi:predicted hotdog family 3-hydroxylacyl-ACP dehydratase
MRLLERVVAHDATSTRCRVDPSASRLFFDARGLVPVWVAIEYMAQCAAAHGGLEARLHGEAPRPGLFVGSRQVEFRCDGFAPGASLEVTARHVAGRARSLAFACRVESPEDGGCLAEGRVSVLLLHELALPSREAQ